MPPLQVEMLKVENLVKYFPARRAGWLRKAFVHAVDDVSFWVERGETLGIAGESGSGKSTIGRCVAGLLRPTSGRIIISGCDVTAGSGFKSKNIRRRVQLVFQDPGMSLNPRFTVRRILSEPLIRFSGVTPGDIPRKVGELMARVGLDPEDMHKFPHQFSGGQQQRVAIARAIAAEPDVIVLDEPTSALDVSVRGQILDLLAALQQEISVSYVFISHDLSTIKQLAHRLAVVYLGQIVEQGPIERVLRSPLHPYARALIASVPIPDPAKRRRVPPLQGEVPSPICPPPGCRFHSRCPEVMARCKSEVPVMVEVEEDHWVLCHRYSGEQTSLTVPVGQPSRR